MENIYVQFYGMVYQQIVGIPMGTNCAPTIADLFLYYHERDFMGNIQKSKRLDLVDKFNDTSRYLDNIFTIDNPQFAEHIPDTYPREHQLNKANTSDTETSFLDLNIKVIGSNIHTSVYDQRDDFGFPIVNFPWLSDDVLRLPSYGIYISQLVPFARCCTSIVDFHSKNLQITSKILTQGYRYHKLCKTFGKFFRSFSELLSRFGAISFQEYVSKGITHPVFYGNLVYKLRRVKSEKKNSSHLYCLIPSKLHMCVHDRIKNIHAQNQLSILRSFVWKAVHNRTFWRTLVHTQLVLYRFYRASHPTRQNSCGIKRTPI